MQADDPDYRGEEALKEGANHEIGRGKLDAEEDCSDWGAPGDGAPHADGSGVHLDPKHLVGSNILEVKYLFEIVGKA